MIGFRQPSSREEQRPCLKEILLSNIFWITAAVQFGLLAGYLSVAEAQENPKAETRWITPLVEAPRLAHHTFDSAAAKTKVSYHIYTPEVYDVQPERRFPVLYWLHGSGGGLAGVPVLAEHFNRAIAAEKIPPMLVVFANGMASSMWCDSQDGRVPMETVVIRELLPHIDATYRTIARREGRLIEGFSMGGYGAARLGFKHDELFGTVSLLGAGPLQQEFDVHATPRANPLLAQAILDAVYGGDQDYFRAQSPWGLAEQHAAALRGKTRVRQVIGDRDNTLENNRKFEAHLTQLDIPHTFVTLAGVGHNPRAVFDALGESNWVFYRAAFGGIGASQPAATP